MLREGGAVNWYRVQDHRGNVGWQPRKPEGYVDVPYTGGTDPFDQEVVCDELFLPEGEKDCDTLVRIGLLAMTFGGTGDGAPEELATYCAGRNVVILADNDEGGRKHAEQKAALVVASAKDVRVVHFPELAEKGDVSDWVALGHNANDLRERAAATRAWTPPAAIESTAAAGRRLIIHRASDLEPEKLVWIWPGRVPEGKLVLLGGPPGLGKSQVTAFISAVVSNGSHWPCGEGCSPQGDVVFMSAEDGIQDTIVPRLMAAGADLERVHIVAAATKMNGIGRKTFSLKTDVDLLEARVRQIGTVRLIIVDPISAYMGGADGNGNVETREVLEPLAEMANRLKIAVVAVTHLNKGGAGNQSALNRFAGSIAFVAAARAAFAIIEDPDDEERRLLLQAKNNLGKKCEGLAFRLEQRLVADDIISSNVMFESEYVSASIDEALNASESRGTGEKGTNKHEAANFLPTVLVGGALPVLQIESEAREAGLLGPDSPISQNKAFRSARKELGIAPQRQGGTAAKGQWVWGLPIH
jgi:AAA domain-containing protein